MITICVASHNGSMSEDLLKPPIIDLIRGVCILALHNLPLDLKHLLQTPFLTLPWSRM